MKIKYLNSWHHINLIPSISIHWGSHQTGCAKLVKTLDIQFAFLNIWVDCQFTKIIKEMYDRGA